MYKVISNFHCDGISKKIGDVLIDSDLSCLENWISFLIKNRLIEEISSESSESSVEPKEELMENLEVNADESKPKEKSKKKSKG